MTAAILMRTDYSTDELLKLAQEAGDGGKVRRLLALAAILDGKNRTEAVVLAGWIDRPCATGFIASMMKVQMALKITNHQVLAGD